MTDYALTTTEQSRLAECNAVIRRGKDVFMEVGMALLEVRDSRLYRAQYPTFEAYCELEHGLRRNRAYQYIEAAEVAGNLSVSKILDKTPNEAQARELARLEPGAQREVWQMAVETAPEGKVTAAHVRDVAQAYSAAVDEVTGEIVVPIEIEMADEALEPVRIGGVPRALQMSVSNEWYTPSQYIEAARRVMGGIDLDPASNPIANQTVRADRYYTQDDDGLSYAWHGRVWLNPPYGRDGGESNQGTWSARLIAEYRAGNVTEAVMLVNAVTDRAWFAPLWDFAICFTDHRIRFYDESGEAGSPTHGNALVYLGQRREVFAQEFKPFGPVVMQVVRDADDFAF